jgi:hypothetical protein
MFQGQQQRHYDLVFHEELWLAQRQQVRGCHGSAATAILTVGYTWQFT